MRAVDIERTAYPRMKGRKRKDLRYEQIQKFPFASPDYDVGYKIQDSFASGILYPFLVTESTAAAHFVEISL